MSVRLPRLLDRSMAEIGRLNPSDATVELNLSPLSKATLVLDQHDAVHVGDYVEMYTIAGSAGVYRVTYVDATFGAESAVELEHGLTTLSDAMMPGKGKASGKAADVMRQLLACQTDAMWQLGEVEAQDEDLTWEYDNTNALEGLHNLLKQLPGYALEYDQSKLPWILHLRKLQDDDACECRLNRNLESVSLVTDYSDLCTVLHVSGLADPLEADTIGTWGRVVRSMDADEKIGETLLRKAGLAYLEEHKNPTITVEMDVFDLCHATGEPFDSFRLGRVCRVCMPAYRQTLRHRVVQVKYNSVYGEPESAKVTLSHVQASADVAIAGLIVDTTITRMQKDMRSQRDLILAAEESIKLYANRLEVLTKEVEVNAESILLKADKIDLQGYVTATALEAELARFDSMLSGSANIDALVVDAIRCNNHLVAQGALTVRGNFNLGDTTLSMREAEIVTGVSGRGVTGEYKTIQYLNWDGAKASTSVCTGLTQQPFSLTKETIRYAGGASNEG